MLEASASGQATCTSSTAAAAMRDDAVRCVSVSLDGVLLAANTDAALW